MKESRTNRSQKFYVLSGDCRQVVQARDADAAALWAVHLFLEENANLDQVDWFDESEIDRPDLIQALLRLGEAVCVSEIGFGRAEAGWFDTADVMTQWQQLVMAVNRMDLEF